MAIQTVQSVEHHAGPLPSYTIRRSARARGIRVTVDPVRGVLVTVPPPTRRGWARPEAEIERFLRERSAWLDRHLARHARQRAAIESRGGLADGSLFRYRGALHRLRIDETARGRTRRSAVRVAPGPIVDELVVETAPGDRRSVRAVLETWLRDEAGRQILESVAAHAPALGVAPAAITFRDPRSRWGSASRRDRLSFSWRLVLAPPEALDTVVVHELAHLRVFGHGPAFWALVASRRPDHLVWRRWLQDHSLELHAALDLPSRHDPLERASA